MNKRFIHIPKTGGTSIKEWLIDVDPNILSGSGLIKDKIDRRVHQRANTFKREQSEKFTIVRNPYLRCLSAFKYLKENNSHSYPEKSIIQDMNFESFIMECLPSFNQELFYAQLYWIASNKGLVVIDKIFYLENLKPLQQYFNTSLKIPVKNSNESFYKKRRNEYFTQEIKDKIYKKYIDDFTFLKYPRDLV